VIFRLRLFWRIFLSFCLTVAVMLSVGALLSRWAERKIGQPPKVQDFLQVYARSAVAQYELAGPQALRKQLQEWSNPFLSHYYLVDARGHELSGSSIPATLANSFPSIVLLPGKRTGDGSTYEYAVERWVVMDRIEAGSRGTYYFAVVFMPIKLLEDVRKSLEAGVADNSPRGHTVPLVPANPLLKFRRVAMNPAHDRGRIHAYAAFRHQLRQIPVAYPILAPPANAHQDDIHSETNGA